MFKPLSACVLAGLSLSALAQSTLPPEEEANLQQRADKYYQTIAGFCKPPLRAVDVSQCRDNAARSREIFVLDGRVAYYAVHKAQSSQQDFLDAAERCKRTTSRECYEDTQRTAEQYYEDKVDAYVETHRW